MFEIIFSEAKKIARTPSRLGQIFLLRRWRQFFGILFFRARTGDRWQNSAAFKRREYSSYEQYVRHQQSKFAHLDLQEYDRQFREKLRERLRGQPWLKPDAVVLCLGARQGTEVRAFRDLGCSAIGLDLNPGPDNPDVLQGDFHNAPFPDHSQDIVFTNSIDHTFDIDKLLAEIKRLLKPGGTLIIEAGRGEAEDNSPDYYASFWWKKIDDLIPLLEQRGFQLLRRTSFEYPWPGEQLCLALHVTAG